MGQVVPEKPSFASMYQHVANPPEESRLVIQSSQAVNEPTIDSHILTRSSPENGPDLEATKHLEVTLGEEMGRPDATGEDIGRSHKGTTKADEDKVMEDID